METLPHRSTIYFSMSSGDDLGTSSGVATTTSTVCADSVGEPSAVGMGTLPSFGGGGEASSESVLAA